MKIKRIGVAAIILAGILSLGLVSGCGKVSVDPQAQVEALEITPDNFEQCRQQLVDWANEGNIYAASKMCDMGLWFSMREVDPENLKKWKNDPQKIDLRTARQVYAMVYANHVGRTRPRAYMELWGDAVELLEEDPIKDCVVMNELICLKRDLDPSCDISKETERLDELLLTQKPSAAEVYELIMWNLIPLSANPELGPAAILSRSEEVDQMCRACGNKELLTQALYIQGVYSQPDRNPDGDWKSALACYEQCHRLAVEQNDPSGQALSLAGMAWCKHPYNDPNGQWLRFIEESKEAADLLLEHDRHRAAANILYGLIAITLPTEYPEGSWEESIDLCKEVAGLYAGQKGLEKERGLFLRLQALCTRPDNNRSGSWTDAAELFVEAADMFRVSGATEEMRVCSSAVAYCYAKAEVQ